MLNSSALAAAFAGAVAIIWFICGLLIWLMPSMMVGMSGHMLHTDFGDMSWHMPLIGFLIGGLAWTVVAGVTGYLIGWLYNRVNGQPG